MMPPYDVTIHFDPAKYAFIAEVPGLPGCQAEGLTRREALSNVELVIREWIETARAAGRPVPEPCSR